MSVLFPHMSDSPESSQTMGGLSYGVIAFVVLPFTLTLFFFQRNPDEVYVVLEYLYQGLNFAMMLAIFRSYLQDSWLNVSIHPKEVLTVSLGAAALTSIGYIAFATAALLGLFDRAQIVFMGALPMTGIELMVLPGQFALLGGLPAMLVLVVLGPITTACMFYATAFAPVCVKGHRVLAYGVLAALLAVPRIITWFTVWGGWKEAALYLVQLPIHFLACWTYQKTNTIWAPIFTHALVNLFCCAALLGMRFLGIIG